MSMTGLIREQNKAEFGALQAHYKVHSKDYKFLQVSNASLGTIKKSTTASVYY